MKWLSHPKIRTSLSKASWGCRNTVPQNRGAYSNKNVFSCSSGGQKSETEVLAKPLSPPKGLASSLPASSSFCWLRTSLGSPWLVAAALLSLPPPLCVWPLPSVSEQLSVFCLSKSTGHIGFGVYPDPIRHPNPTRPHLNFSNYICKDSVSK